MSKIITIGYYTKFLVKNSLVAHFVEMLGAVQLLEGSDSSGTLKPVEFEVKTPHPDLGREMSQREKELEKAAEDKNNMWYKEYTKANKLEKELAAAKEQINLLVEEGIKGAFCPLTTAVENEEAE